MSAHHLDGHGPQAQTSFRLSGTAILVVLIGLAIAAAGAWIVIFEDLEAIYGALAICVGFGIILVMIGSNAAWKYRGASASGAGAMAIILFLILMQYVPSKNAFLMRGQIAIPIRKIADLRIVDDRPLYTFRNRNTRAIEFVILKRHFANPQIRLQVDTTDEGPGKEFFQLDGNGDDIAKRYFGNSRYQVIKWVLDYDRRVVTDGQRVIFKERNRLNEALIKQTRNRARPFAASALFIGRARAQSTTVHPKIKFLIQDLTSPQVAIRRNARDDLVSLGPAAVKPMLNAFQKAPDRYRIKLGVVYSLNGMLRENPAQNTTIAGMLSDSDLKLLAAATADNDKTVRLQAAEFMFQLKDKRMVMPVLQTIRDSTNSDSIFNSVLILKSVYPTLDARTQKFVKAELAKEVPSTSVRTRALIEQFAVAK